MVQAVLTAFAFAHVLRGYQGVGHCFPPRGVTDLKRGYATRNFDVSPDNEQIVFDRVQENSDVVLSNLPRR